MGRAKILGDQEPLAVVRTGSKESMRAERGRVQTAVKCLQPHFEQELSLGRESRLGYRIHK